MKKRLLPIILSIVILLGITFAVCIFGPFQPHTENPPVQRSAVDEVYVPILLFHHLDADAYNSMVVTPDYFDTVLTAVKQAGYSTVTVKELIDFVDMGAALPEKPVLITFDDGYLSNLELAAPILKRHDMTGVVFVIGVSVGKETYKDTGVAITPHFSWADAGAAADVFEIQSHTYDMHNTAELDTENFREGVLPRTDESAAAYKKAFRKDFKRSKKELESGMGTKVTAFAYPYGLHNETTEQILKDAGVRMSLLISEGPNLVRIGDPESLFLMNRMIVKNDTPTEEILQYLALRNESSP